MPSLARVTASCSFHRHGPAEPDSPVVLSVPHAGRDYPLPLRAALRVPLAAIRGLEDRHADAIALGAREIESASWMLLVPAGFLVVLLVCFNFLGDGLRDALDPHER